LEKQIKLPVEDEGAKDDLLPPSCPSSVPAVPIIPDNSHIKVLFTGLKNVSGLKDIVIRLGGKVTSSHSECTHLITDRIARTQKFLCAFNYAKHILSPSWLEQSDLLNKFLDERSFTLSDQEKERQFDVILHHSLNRRNTRGDLLFDGIVLYITSGCIPSPIILKSIIDSAGGIGVMKRRPTRKQLHTMREMGKKFAVVTCENDLHLCDMFFSLGVSVQNVEFVLTGILKQEIDYESYAFKRMSIQKR